MADSCPFDSVPGFPASEIAAAWQRELPGTPFSSIEIVTPIWRLAKLLADDRRRVLQACGVDPATLDLLSVIRRAGPPYRLSTREITARALVTAGAVSQRIARAEQAGLVERSAAAGSRGVLVSLTATGHELIERTVERVLDRESQLVQDLDAGKRSALAAALNRLLAGVASRMSGESAAAPLMGKPEIVRLVDAVESPAPRPAFVPADFEVPLELAAAGFRLVPLGPEHNADDYQAWTSSIEHIRQTPGFAGRTWPEPAMTIDQNLGDLHEHAADFARRKGFTYTVLDAANGEVAGCLYIYPSRESGYDADVRSWVRVDHAGRDAALRAAVRDWLAACWPFRALQ
jgi:DNA-binding MarR family transcriptional regulator